jgi:nucleoside-diphosphate-sugar epimerase
LQLEFQPFKAIIFPSSIKMLVFVTGAAGFIGRAVVQELLNNGHHVLGLAHNNASAEAITKAGAEPHRGDLEDIESLKSGARVADGVIHLAFIHDFSDFARVTAVDRAAIEAMGEVMAGTGKPLVIASGTLVVPKGKLATEDTEAEKGTLFADRARSADLVYTLSMEKQVHGSVVRLPPSVHGAEDRGIIPWMIDLARQNGFVTYVGDGSARWPTVHRLDAAVLFRLAVEKGAAGATYNAVAEQAVPIKDITTVIGKHLQLPVEGKALSEALGVLGFLAGMVNSDNPTSSEKTQRELGWHPTQPELLVDMEANYFSQGMKSKYSA